MEIPHHIPVGIGGGPRDINGMEVCVQYWQYRKCKYKGNCKLSHLPPVLTPEEQAEDERRRRERAEWRMEKKKQAQVDIRK